MDRRKALATTGAVGLTATAAVIALGSSIGLFGLADDGGSRIGKLSPVGSTSPTSQTSVATLPSTSSTTPSTGVPSTVVPNTTPNTLATPGTTTNTRPDGDDLFDDHGGLRDDDDHDNSGPGSDDGGHDEDDHDNSGPGSDDSGHDDDD